MKTTFIISIFLATAIIAGSCNNPSGSATAQTQTTQKTVSTAGTIPVSLTSVEETPAAVSKGAVESINAAKAAGKPVFLVVTGTGATGIDKAMTIAHAANFISKNVVVLQMNRDHASNAKLVAEYRLSGTPVPLILVISSKGMPAGGYFLEQATAENLAALIPSPRLEDVFDTIARNKNALVVLSRKTFTDKAEVLKECRSAVTKLNGISYFFIISSLLLMKVKPAKILKSKVNILKDVKEGVSYVFDCIPMRYIILFLALANLLAVPYTVLLPAFAKDILAGGSNIYGFLVGASGFGALLGALYLASIKTPEKTGKLIPWSAIIFGLG